MSELDKLAKYLHKIKMPFKQYECDKQWDVDDCIIVMDRHQICVPNQEYPIWDAICQRGSYGYKEGLLEIYGVIVDEAIDDDTVVGWLTAEDVIKRLEKTGLNNPEKMLELVRLKYHNQVDCAWGAL